MSKEISPQFSLYAQDFLTGVTFLTNEETGIYIKLLCKQWTNGRIAKKRLGLFLGYEWDSLSDELKEKFVDQGDHFYNERLEIERSKLEAYREKQRANGMKGGRPKKLENSEEAEEQKHKQNPTETQTKPKENPGVNFGITQTKPNANPEHNPDESQTKARAFDIDIDINKESIKSNKGKSNNTKDNSKTKKEEKEVTYPFDTESFKTHWQLWKAYKRKEHGFKYKSRISEQGALTELGNLADGNEQDARKIIDQSIAKGWKGFFKLERKQVNKTNGIPAASKSASIIETNQRVKAELGL